MKAIGWLAIVLAVSACAQESGSDQPLTQAHHGDHTASSEAANLTAAQRDFAAVNDRMHAGMSNISADADIAFMQGMLAHHIGAVEMSQVVLEHGQDPQTRDLAERIIAAQQAEIEEMRAWLAAKGVEPESPASAD
ncbi:MAG: DUF305 domain-containing protein [Erythrobacter sp.]